MIIQMQAVTVQLANWPNAALPTSAMLTKRPEAVTEIKDC